MKKPDIESLKALLHDGRVHIATGKILQLEISEDRSIWLAKVEVYPDQYEVVAQMTWGQVGPDAGIFGPAIEGDMVLLAFDQEMDEVYIISRLSSNIDTIPQQAIDGDTIIKAIAGKKAHIASDTRINIGKGEAEPTEPLVLGLELKTLLSYIFQQLIDMNTEISTHYHAGNLGAPTSAPTTASNFTAIGSNISGKKASPVDDNKINSDISFTEKGV